MLYDVKFPSSEEDCKKVFTFRKKREGARHYSRPIMANFIETFDSCVMTVLWRKTATKGKTYRVDETRRSVGINDRPCEASLRYEAERMYYSCRDARNYSIEEIMEQMTDIENQMNDAIGIALTKI